MVNIRQVAAKLGLAPDDIVCYGEDKAKIKLEAMTPSPMGKLVLVTAMSPSPAGRSTGFEQRNQLQEDGWATLF